MKALVTGACSYIGSTLIEELDTLGFEVHALIQKTSDCSQLEGLKYQRVDGELSDYDSLCQAVRGVDYVFHLGQITHTPNRKLLFEINAKGTEKLGRAVANYCPTLSRFVYLSSLAASGPAQSIEPKIESSINKPVSNYGESKLQGERELCKYAHHFPMTIIRPPVVYGPKSKSFLNILQIIARNFVPIIQGSALGGHKYYSAIHVRDLCRGVVQAAVASQAKVASGEVFYLAGDGFHSYQEWMTMIAERLNCDPLKIKVPSIAVKIVASSLGVMSFLTNKNFPIGSDRFTEILSDYWICSNQKAKAMLGFSPEFDAATGISQAIDWYKRQKWI